MRPPLSSALLLAALAFVASVAPSPLRAAPVFTLPNATGILEGLAWRAATGDFFLGDVHHRCIWRRDPSGTLTRFSSPDDSLFGVFALSVDEPRHLLWAATSMLPEAENFTPADRGRAALVALDLDTGRVTHTYPLPADGTDHVLGDLLLAPEGAIYLTDSLTPVIWHLAPGGTQLERWLESPTFRSLQGLTLLADARSLLVSDYSHGLFAIDLATRAFHPLAALPDVSLRGIDGLLAVGSALLAVQNGTNPQRILRLTPSPNGTAITRVDPLLTSDSAFGDFTLLTLVRGRPHVIANSGWALADPAKSPVIAAHTPAILRLAP